MRPFKIAVLQDGSSPSLNWINPVTGVARGINLNQTIPWVASGSQGIKMEVDIQFDASTDDTKDYGIVGTTAGGANIFKVTSANNITLRSIQTTGPVGFNLFDGNVHTVIFEKTNSSATGVTVDGVFWGSGSVGQSIDFNFLGGVTTQANVLSWHGIIKRFIYTTPASEVVINMPIDDGSGAVIANNGTSGIAGSVIGTENTDYQWT